MTERSVHLDAPALRLVGRRLVALCPFHNEKTPSLSIQAGLGRFRCFGCGATGSAVLHVDCNGEIGSVTLTTMMQC